MSVKADIAANLHQYAAAVELLARAQAYAKSIGCTTYESGALADSIEVHTGEQMRLLAEWWATNTTPKSGDTARLPSVNPSADKGSP